MRLFDMLAASVLCCFSLVACSRKSQSDAAPLQAASINEGPKGIQTEADCETVLAVSCGEDISLADAKKAAPKSHHAKTQSSLRTVTAFNVCDEAETIGYYYFWAPQEKFVDGEAALTLLNRRLNDGEEISPGYVIVQVAGADQNEQHLALCKVNHIDNVIGPPRECTTVAVITPRETWLRGGNPNQGLCLASASFRETGAIDIKFNVQTASVMQTFADSLLKMMTSDFGLKAEQREVRHGTDWESTFITSAAPLRVSQILSGGWREAFDLDVELWSEKNEVKVQGVAHILLCRQALGNLNDYQGPTDSQRSTYAAVLDSHFEEAIKAVCQNFNKRDSTTISCM